MRVGIDCRYMRERPSGIGAYVEALVDRLPRLAPNDQFAFWAHRLAREPFTTAPNATATVVPIEPNSLWTILWPERYASFDGLDLFHAPHNILSRHVPCPSVVTIHDLLPLEYPNFSFVPWNLRVKRLYYAKAMRHGLKCATRLITTTSVMADRLDEFVPGARKRAEIVPLGVKARFRPTADASTTHARAQQLIGSDAPYFLVVGQASLHKRHKIALEAFARFAPERYRIVFVQRQTIRSPLERMAVDLGLTKRISWFPYLDSADLVALYQGATALIQPSIYEGFGLPLLEAMASGCPPIATDLPVFREVIGHAGLFAAADDVESFGRAMASLIECPSRRADLSAAGMARAEMFTWDRCAQGTLEVYRQALSA